MSQALSSTTAALQSLSGPGDIGQGFWSGGAAINPWAAPMGIGQAPGQATQQAPPAPVPAAATPAAPQVIIQSLLPADAKTLDIASRYINQGNAARPAQLSNSESYKL
jgi:hypothetical protein